MQKPRPKILVIADDEALRYAVEALLLREGYEVRAKADGRDVQDEVCLFSADLAIIDVGLPLRLDGYSSPRLLGYLDVPLILLSSAGTLKDRIDGFEAGADDYLVKPFSMQELLARAQALLRRCGKLASGARQVGELIINELERSVTRGGHTLELTRTEFELLLALAYRPNQVMSKSQLLNRVWGSGYHGENLVEVHICALRHKLEAHGDRLVHTVRGVGYVLRT